MTDSHESFPENGSAKRRVILLRWFAANGLQATEAGIIPKHADLHRKIVMYLKEHPREVLEQKNEPPDDDGRVVHVDFNRQD